jgi:hypothetical protein
MVVPDVRAAPQADTYEVYDHKPQNGAIPKTKHKGLKIALAITIPIVVLAITVSVILVILLPTDDEEPYENPTDKPVAETYVNEEPAVDNTLGDTPAEKDDGVIETVEIDITASFDGILASSVRPPMKDKGGTKTVNYQAELALDGNWSTAWCEGATGRGLGEWIELRSDESQRVKGIRILNGYYKSNDLYYANNAIARLTIVTDDGSESYSLAHSADGWQDITFYSLIDTARIRIVIDAVYDGREDVEDTLISEIEIISEMPVA